MLAIDRKRSYSLIQYKKQQTLTLNLDVKSKINAVMPDLDFKQLLAHDRFEIRSELSFAQAVRLKEEFECAGLTGIAVIIIMEGDAPLDKYNRMPDAQIQILNEAIFEEKSALEKQNYFDGAKAMNKQAGIIWQCFNDAGLAREIYYECALLLLKHQGIRAQRKMVDDCREPLIKCFQNLGSFSMKMEQPRPEDAINFFEEKRRLCEQDGNDEELEDVLNRLGRLYAELKDFKKAISCYEKAYLIIQDLIEEGKCGNTHLMMKYPEVRLMLMKSVMEQWEKETVLSANQK